MRNINKARPQYLNLDIRAPMRLGALRYAASQEPKRFEDWRAARQYGFGNWAAAYCALDQGKNGETPIWYCHTGPAFRGERFADECENGPDHTGWFSDVDQSEKVRGIVARLSHGRFIAGYHWSSNGERVYFPAVYTDETEAARAADSHAESYADDAREDSEKFEQARELEEKIARMEKSLRPRIYARNRSFTDRAEVRDDIRELRDMRARLQSEFSDYV